ncbi:helix-turn-helix transcriptional regulator [Nocardia terpenica]|uniref:helix-turn-helix domain-containing protein n=1 Tax=Nocardia terpenica TaxID=455432 RepID=UPI001893D78F|nr:helix-turn-helix transcriptional regulator [Nocardia terpenica]MBF6060563.1 helix-turn-helix transcriptional regulator [Nocardia terpenica]MBF6103823.1 helix-turn-helix transcriptional regulator [Nocardia terpenica]MBF6111803.1 helix-turn-helix transcriptional regulator [Nocardia terpenica]MBF6118044.1 helix-turn-helix transcriptional regulator [Nocardia terpenica]MBF6155230.1 helix-turn-helix transcriptional regulator [Nocardia terpenica]
MTARAIGPLVRIRNLREAQDITVRELILRIVEYGGPGVHEDTIRNIELGHRRASDELMHAWARALGADPLDIVQPPRCTPRRGKTR